MNFGQKTFDLARACKYVLSAAIAAAIFAGRAQEFRFESAGVGFGFSPSSADHNFHEAEVFAGWSLPWAWDLGRDWRLKSGFNLFAGWVGDPGGDAAIAAFGPALRLEWQNFPLVFEGGLSPTLLSQHQFQTKDLGSYFQFTSYAGLNWDVSAHFRVLYRFQHMSNAGLASPNPGLNMHMFGMSYIF